MILPHEDATLYFRLMWGVQLYVNQQRQLLPEVPSREAYVHLPSEKKVMVRDTLWTSPDLIDAYVKANPDHLTQDELTIILKWKVFVAGDFYVLRYLKTHAIFMGGSKVYGVLGLYEHLDDVLGGHPLPAMIQTVLLPFKGKIIYDGLCQIYNLYFGSGIRSELTEAYLTAKQNGKIILSLEPEAAAAPQSQPRRKLDKDSVALVAEMLKASEHLRGGTAIQSATFGLLRASARAAQAAIERADDLEELWQLERQAENALNRLRTALARAEDA